MSNKFFSKIRIQSTFGYQLQAMIYELKLKLLYSSALSIARLIVT